MGMPLAMSSADMAIGEAKRAKVASGDPSTCAHCGTAVPAEIRLSDARQEDGEARFRATARLDRISFGVTKKKGMVGRTVDLVIEAVAQPA